MGTWSSGRNYIRFDFRDDVKCNGTGDAVQIGMATLTLTDIQATDLSVVVSGVAEAEFESLTLVLDNNVLLNVQPRDGHAGQSCSKNTCIMCDVVEPEKHVHLTAGNHTLRITVNSVDSQYHIGAYFKVYFSLRSGDCGGCSCDGPCTDSDIAALAVADQAGWTIRGCADGARLCDDPDWGAQYGAVCPETCNQCPENDCVRNEALLPLINVNGRSPTSCEDRQFFPDVCNGFLHPAVYTIASAACPDVCNGVCRPSSPDNDGTTQPPGPPGPPGATGDPHMINALGESYEIKQPGQYSLLRVPRHGPAALSMNGTIHSIGNPCSLFITEANLTGVLFGDDLVRVRSGWHDEFHGEAELFSLQVAESEPWVSLSSVPPGQEVVLRKHRISGLSITISAHREASEHDVQGFFMIAVAVPRRNEHAQIKIARRYQSTRAEWMNINVARLGHFGWKDSIGGALGMDAPLKKWMEPTEACSHLRTSTDHRSSLLQIASEEAHSVASANF